MGRSPPEPPPPRPERVPAIPASGGPGRIAHQRLAHPAHHQRLRPPQPLEAVELNFDPPKPRRRRFRLGRHAGAEAGQSIERRLQGRGIGRRIRVEE
jgi:hypothetical protein